MPSPTEIKEAMEQAAEDGIQFASGDQGAVRKYSIEDQIKAINFAQGSSSVENPHRGLRFTKMRPPGSQ